MNPLTLHLRELALLAVGGIGQFAHRRRTMQSAELRAEQDRKHLIFTTVQEGLVLQDAHGTIVDWNPATERILGVTGAELAGSTATDQRWGAIHPDGRPLAPDEHPSVRARRTRQPVLDELTGMVRADGTVTWVVVNAEPMLDEATGEVDGVVVSFVDITARQAAEEARRAAEEQVRSSFEHAVTAMALIGLDGNYLGVNTAMCTLLGRDRDDVLDRPALDFIHPDDRDQAIAAGQRVLAGDVDRVEDELRIVRPDGQAVWGRFVTGAIPDGSGGPGHLRTHVDDITAEREVRAELNRTRDRLVWQAFHDTLTGLPNRALLLERLDHALILGRRHGDRTALMFIDLDRFKTVNDTFGHAAGDRLLVEVADRLSRTVRAGDTVARLGGDEFVVLAEHVRAGEDLRVLAHRINDVLAHPIDLPEGTVTISASIGLAYDRDHTPDSLLRDADGALYRAKTRGKNRVELFDGQLRAEAFRRVTREQILRRALEAPDGIAVHYQPVIDLSSGVLLCAEALMRIRGPHDRFESTEDFIPIAEETGLIVTIGAGVIDDACQQLARWRQTHGLDAPRQVAVNVSARQLATPGLRDTVVRTLERAGLHPRDLCLELTESTLITAEGSTSQTVEELHGLGVSLAIDDFGTGYSSLSYLKRFPVDILKLDRTFVTGFGTNPSDTEIVKAVISLGRSLGLTTVAEGIETRDQLTALQALGCDAGQGYLLARPYAGDEMMAAVDRLRARVDVA